MFLVFLVFLVSFLAPMCDLSQPPDPPWWEVMPLRNNLHFFSSMPYQHLRGNLRTETKWCDARLQTARKELYRETLELMKGTLDNEQNKKYLYMLQGVYNQEIIVEGGYRRIVSMGQSHHPRFPPGTPLTAQVGPGGCHCGLVVPAVPVVPVVLAVGASTAAASGSGGAGANGGGSGGARGAGGSGNVPNGNAGEGGVGNCGGGGLGIGRGGGSSAADEGSNSTSVGGDGGRVLGA